MAKSLFDGDNFDIILTRIDSLSAKSQPRWGKMNVAQMLGHLEKAINSALERNSNTSFNIKRLLLANPIGKGIMFGIPEWPKNMPAPPEYVITDNVEFNNNLENCKNRLASLKNSKERFGAHPIFGDMSKDEWGKLLFKHADHHLKQFGV